MANTQAICDSFRIDLLNGTHAFGTQGANGVRTVTTKDVFKAALFLATATINRSTTAYAVTGEVSGTGYTAGGVTVTNANLPGGATCNDGKVWPPAARCRKRKSSMPKPRSTMRKAASVPHAHSSMQRKTSCARISC